MNESDSLESPQVEQNKIERQGNVVTIKKPEGLYTVVYGTHIIGEAVKFPPSIDGICLEGGTEKYPTTNEEMTFFMAPNPI